MIVRELSEKELAEIHNRHGYHKPASPDVAENHEKIRELFENVECAVMSLLPGPSRCASLVATKLDEARMWANMAIATTPGFGAKKE